ncbi:helix-turn-helix domain-containing protein [Apilactobacillus micheneri]|uniref:helix-turn-helix domain-containing protein n=1 Tax=Apilactobacillus micheneri TaxID=1899430 RepID=UPI000D51C75D|nr:helix-turn-helix transcriptional regulator [Apilactobacillus micheneri]GAY80037.1 hypothetical protein NBRC113063_00902 [Apilactobacillus micheneri]
MKTFDMTIRKRATKNNLNKIMDCNNWTSYYVSQMTGVDIKTISNIRHNEFAVINSNTLLSISYNLKINLNDLIQPVNNILKSESKIKNVKFNEQLGEILHKHTKLYFRILPYCKNRCVNIYSKYLHKFRFKGNFRINYDDTMNPRLQIIDFDFYIYKNYTKIDIKKFVINMIFAIEEYSRIKGLKILEYIVDSLSNHGNLNNGNLIVRSNGDDIIINSLIENGYVNCKYKNKDLIISNIEEIFKKCGNNFSVKLYKKIK